jgi:hypothetical protein
MKGCNQMYSLENIKYLILGAGPAPENGMHGWSD